MSADSKEPTLEQLAQELQKAGDRWADASAAARQASLHETECLNRVNAAQRAFDRFVAEMKKKAPSFSDWRKS